MKLVFSLILLLSMLELQAAEIKIKKMVRDGVLERSFILKTNIKEVVVLDCQSFVQGLRIGQYESAHTVMLDEQECQALQERIKSSLRKFQKHCLDVDQDIRADYSCN